MVEKKLPYDIILYMNMNVMMFEKYGTHMAVIKTTKVLASNDLEFAEFVDQAITEAQATNIVADKAAFPEELFDYTSGLARDLDQRLSNKRAEICIVGNFDKYELKSFNEFTNINFCRSVNEGISFFAD